MNRSRRSRGWPLAAAAGAILAAGGRPARAEEPVAAQAMAPAPSVHVNSDGEPVTLYRLDPDRWVVNGGVGQRGVHSGVVEHWVRVCDTPCDAVVNRQDAFVVAGDDVTPSKSFALNDGVTSLRVKRGSAGAFTTGVTAALAGSGLAMFGLTVLLMSSGQQLPPRSTPPNWAPSLGNNLPPDRSMDTAGSFHTLGLVTLIVGGAVAVAGVLTALQNRTTVEQ